MSAIELHDVLAFVRWPAMDRLRSLMDRVKMVDLTPQEILALVAVSESADCPRSRTPHPGLKQAIWFLWSQVQRVSVDVAKLE
jgi:hypothetical protein